MFNDDQQRNYDNGDDIFNTNSYSTTDAEQNFGFEGNTDITSDENVFDSAEDVPDIYGDIDMNIEDLNNNDTSIPSDEVSEMNNNWEQESINIPNIIPSVDEQIELQNKLTDIDIEKNGADDNGSSEISFTGKACPTRHGCSGATDCDYCGGDYPF